MKSLTEYIQKKHINLLTTDEELIQVHMDDYKKISYKSIMDLTDDSTFTVWKQALSVIKEMCDVNEFTGEEIKKFLTIYYELFINLTFDDDRINNKRTHLLKMILNFHH